MFTNPFSNAFQAAKTAGQQYTDNNLLHYQRMHSHIHPVTCTGHLEDCNCRSEAPLNCLPGQPGNEIQSTTSKLKALMPVASQVFAQTPSIKEIPYLQEQDPGSNFSNRILCCSRKNLQYISQLKSTLGMSLQIFDLAWSNDEFKELHPNYLSSNTHIPVSFSSLFAQSVMSIYEALKADAMGFDMVKLTSHVNPLMDTQFVDCKHWLKLDQPGFMLSQSEAALHYYILPYYWYLLYCSPKALDKLWLALLQQKSILLVDDCSNFDASQSCPLLSHTILIKIYLLKQFDYINSPD